MVLSAFWSVLAASLCIPGVVLSLLLPVSLSRPLSSCSLADLSCLVWLSGARSSPVAPVAGLADLVMPGPLLVLLLQFG